jgi:hypothetical protein
VVERVHVVVVRADVDRTLGECRHREVHEEPLDHTWGQPEKAPVRHGSSGTLDPSNPVSVSLTPGASFGSVRGMLGRQKRVCGFRVVVRFRFDGTVERCQTPYIRTHTRRDVVAALGTLAVAGRSGSVPRGAGYIVDGVGWQRYVRHAFQNQTNWRSRSRVGSTDEPENEA